LSSEKALLKEELLMEDVLVEACVEPRRINGGLAEDDPDCENTKFIP
jgi:hypothetical protein